MADPGGNGNLIMSEKDKKWGSFRNIPQTGAKRIEKETWLPGELYRNRRLEFPWPKMTLKQNMQVPISGTIWAFIQPIVTICVYWLYLVLALRGGADRGVPLCSLAGSRTGALVLFSGRADRRDQFSSGI